MINEPPSPLAQQLVVRVTRRGYTMGIGRDPEHSTTPHRTTTMTAFATGQIIKVDFPALNKNDRLADNDRKIADRSYTEICRIDKIIDVSVREYCAIGSALLADDDRWEKIGGRDLSPDNMLRFREICEARGCSADEYTSWVGNDEIRDWFRDHAVTVVVAVVSDGLPPFFVNTEGYGYARYVGRLA